MNDDKFRVQQLVLGSQASLVGAKMRKRLGKVEESEVRLKIDPLAPHAKKQGITM